MCGIIGYKGYKKASSILFKGIKNLEYRGYDSIGMATIDDGKIIIKKDIGKIDEADKKSNFLESEGDIGIAHTRWATNGRVTKENSHPHLSMDGNIALVHNGIIENYQELKEFLEKEGFNFKSETDTEVIPNLMQYYTQHGNDFKEAFRNSLLKLNGSFAIVAINKKTKNLVFARKGSPLVIGLRDNEYFLASDVPAFLENTKKVIYLDEDEYGIIDTKLEIYDIISDKIKQKHIKIIEWTVEQAQKGDYSHFMLKEINEQRYTIKKAGTQDSFLIKEVVKILNQAQGVFFVGCGTSYHAAISSSYIFSHIAKKHVNVTLASEFRNYSEFLTDKTVMVAISQSGETADLLDAVKIAKSKGVKVISIINVMGSTLTRVSDINIMMNSGPEICVLSTKSYTSQLTILLLLAYVLAGKEDEAKELINQTSEEVQNIIDNSLEKIENIAEKIKDKEDLFLIGRDLAFPSALEGALKIKEVSYIHAEGFAGGEIKHGTIALIEQGTPCITLVTDATREMILSNAAEIKARGGHIIGINSKNNPIYEDFIKVKELGNANPIVMIVPIQLLSYYLALKRNCDPDKPRNLAKSVTVR
jgi:glutamine---fructose-6-phosphate transaminase (isomerizing)